MYSSFRLRFDLSYFFRDGPKFCWIFVDETKVQQVMHIKQHIKNLFNIKDSFHLMLNDDEYLPPTEDIRILKENETIKVAPGSSMDDHILSTSDISDMHKHDNFARIEMCDCAVQTECQTVDFQMTEKRTKCISDSTLGDDQPVSTDNTNINITSHDVNKVAEADSDTTTVDNLITATVDTSSDKDVTDSISLNTIRRRVQRRGLKIKSQLVTSSPDTNHKSNLNKPKIIDCVIMPAAKQTMREIPHNNSSSDVVPAEQFYTRLQTSADSLAKEETKVGNVAEAIIKLHSKEDTSNISKDRSVRQEETNINIYIFKHFKKADIEKMPIMFRMPQINDVIAFKATKTRMDGTLQMTKFIIAVVVTCHVQPMSYTLKIIGVEEFEPLHTLHVTPGNESDIIICNCMQILEPRLLTIFCSSFLL